MAEVTRIARELRTGNPSPPTSAYISINAGFSTSFFSSPR